MSFYDKNSAWPNISHIFMLAGFYNGKIRQRRLIQHVSVHLELSIPKRMRSQLVELRTFTLTDIDSVNVLLNINVD